MKILEPLYGAVTAIMVAFHTLFKSIGLDPAGGTAWALSIVGLVIVIRILLIPLFVKQIKAQRGMQVLQPEIKKIQAKYKGRSDPESRQKQQQEMMKLYKDNGTNPLSSCLPILLQAPIFFALFHVLNGLPKPKGFLDGALPGQAADAELFGVHISDQFIGADSVRVQVLTAVLILLMSGTTFLTQKQLMSKNMPASAMDNPFARQQKMLLYVFPLIFMVTGVNFPVGVLLYWLTTNVWSMGQQFYVIRRNPSPGSPAYEAYQARKQERAARKGGGAPGESATATEVPTDTGAAGGPRPGQRQQPKRKPRGKRTGPTGSAAATTSQPPQRGPEAAKGPKGPKGPPGPEPSPSDPAPRGETSDGATRGAGSGRSGRKGRGGGGSGARSAAS